ncbi:MAG: putative DNA binding domain-containing protein [Clostridiales Family XIII bacterium]|nr:putative DNA binding domain-containing protein [Clostridiales Family XIII bacterium]
MIENLEVLLSEGETYTVEFKKNPDKTLPAEACAFANASGGRIFIGIADNNKLVGTDISNKARARVRDTIGKLEPELDYTITIDKDCQVYIVDIPEGKEKPYSCPDGIFMRMGDGKQKLSRDQILEFIKREGNVRYDEIVREDLPIADRFDEEAYKRFLSAAKISDVLERDAVLKNLSCAMEVNRKTVFTNAGALFFRQNREDIKFQHAAVICVLYKGLRKITILDEQEYNADIVSNIDNALAFLKRNLRTRFEISAGPRREIPELPDVALKEAITNAATHRDYFEKGASTMVEIFDDRVDITNPGGAPSGITRKNFGTISITRNPIIATLMNRIDYIEKVGTGIGRMCEATAEAGVAVPVFEIEDFFRVTFARPEFAVNGVNAEPIKADKWTMRVFEEPIKADKWTVGISEKPIKADKKPISNEERILALLKERTDISNMDVRELLGLADSTVKRLLAGMVNGGLIEAVGANKGRRYRCKG